MSRKPRRSLTAGIDFSTDEGKSLLELDADSSGDEEAVTAGSPEEHNAMRRRASADSDNSDSTSDASDRPKRRSSADSDASAQSQPHNPGVQPQQRRPRRRRSAPDVGDSGSASGSAAAGPPGAGGSRTVQSRREYHNKAERERTKKINGLIQVRATNGYPLPQHKHTRAVCAHQPSTRRFRLFSSASGAAVYSRLPRVGQGIHPVPCCAPADAVKCWRHRRHRRHSRERRR